METEVIRLTYTTTHQQQLAVPYIVDGQKNARFVTLNKPVRAVYTVAQLENAIVDIEHLLGDGRVLIDLHHDDNIQNYFESLLCIKQLCPALYDHVTREDRKEGWMQFLRLMKDDVALVKQDGTTIDNIRASVQKDKIFIADGSLPIEEGDRLVRKLPNGLKESFVVEDRGYFAQYGHIQHHYQAAVRREGTTPLTPNSAIYQAIGTGSRINVGSHDNSTTVVMFTTENVFAELKKKASLEIDDAALKEQIIAAIDNMAKAKGTSGFLAKYQQFISLAADHVTVFAPLLPVLAQCLT